MDPPAAYVLLATPSGGQTLIPPSRSARSGSVSTFFISSAISFILSRFARSASCNSRATLSRSASSFSRLASTLLLFGTGTPYTVTSFSGSADVSAVRSIVPVTTGADPSRGTGPCHAGTSAWYC